MKSLYYYELCPRTSDSKFPCQNIRFSHRHPKLQKSRNIFYNIVRRAKRSFRNVKGTQQVNAFSLLDYIIPYEYFGIQRHRKLFYGFVKLILTCSAHECIYKSQLLSGINFYKIPWLTGFLEAKEGDTDFKQRKDLCRRYYGESQVWLLDKIVKPLVVRLYAPVRRGLIHEIEFVPRRTWMSFQNKVFNKMRKQDFLTPANEGVRVRGVLQIKPKDDYANFEKVRPIVRLTEKRTNVNQIKNIASEVHSAAVKMCKTKTGLLYSLWKDFVTFTSGKPLFAVKIDIHDAFGNVNIDYLCRILMESTEISQISKTFLIPHIKHQFVSFRKTKAGRSKIFRWNHGLLQGDRFSAILCQFYLSHLDSIHLEEFYKDSTLMHRTVDDYFFCSTRAEDVKEFIIRMSSIHVLNEDKTESNLPEYGNREIAYCGQLFIIETRQVERLFAFHKRIEIRHRFKLWNIKKPVFCKEGSQATNKIFLKKAMSFGCNNFLFKCLELNTNFNTEKTVIKNFFQAMIMLAYKFDAAVMAVSARIKNFDDVLSIIQQTVHKYAHRTTLILNLHKGRHHSGELSFSTFIKIGFRAFKLVFQRRSQYNRHNLSSNLENLCKKISVRGIDFREVKKLPKCFLNISTQRRLPHHKMKKYTVVNKSK